MFDSTSSPPGSGTTRGCGTVEAIARVMKKNGKTTRSTSNSGRRNSSRSSSRVACATRVIRARLRAEAAKTARATVSAPISPQGQLNPVRRSATPAPTAAEISTSAALRLTLTGEPCALGHPRPGEDVEDEDESDDQGPLERRGNDRPDDHADAEVDEREAENCAQPRATDGRCPSRPPAPGTPRALATIASSTEAPIRARATRAMPKPDERQTAVGAATRNGLKEAERAGDECR